MRGCDPAAAALVEADAELLYEQLRRDEGDAAAGWLPWADLPDDARSMFLFAASSPYNHVSEA